MFWFLYIPLLLFANPFVLPPSPITETEILEGAKGRTLCMHWSLKERGYFEFETSQENLFFEIVLTELPASFTLEEKALFREEERTIEGIQKSAFVFSYGKSVAPATAPTSYAVFERRVFEKASPQPLSLEELLQICREKNVIFYTGAGISAGAQVPMMKELEENLGLKKGEGALKKIVQDPEKAASFMRKFHVSCVQSLPTPAHKALTELAHKKKMPILTENVDYLHEWTGVLPYRIIADQLDPSWVENIDAVVCIGLSVDDKGFLGWYKHHHPKGKIIAIDLKQPMYLGDDDYFLSGDLQEIVFYLPKNI
ncbi:MAG: hypothetical protein JSR58_01430 [Verrucomicrobia bacterium]|nr:hypothetical protein [Verrucomicrobiota bacterium]